MRALMLICLVLGGFIRPHAQEILFDRYGQCFSAIERFSIKSGRYPDFHFGLRKFDRAGMIQYLSRLKEQDSLLHPFDLEELELALDAQYIPLHRPENPDIPDSGNHFPRKTNTFFRHFYKTKADLYAVGSGDFYLKANPVANFSLGREVEPDHTIFHNTRGLILEGGLGQNFYFYSSFYENQGNFPIYVEQNIGQNKAIPGNGFFKSYTSTVLPEVYGHDYSNSQAYISARLHKNISTQFGHGRFNIGHGIRSLLLSDYAQNYLFLALNTQVWKFHYHNIFAELASTSAKAIPGDVLLPKKYMATHYLSYRLGPQVELGFFESVIFSRDGHFELQYLNPVILYRSVEQFLGSPDNMLIGADFNLSFLRQYKIYGQLVLDEFRLHHILENDGWWGNKYGLQLGIKGLDIAGINHLDMMMEGNFVRPFTYSHKDSTTNYAHYNQPLAHPLGSSFYECITRVSYQAFRSLKMEGTAIFAVHGRDKDGENYGGDIFRTSNDRLRETGYFTADGNTQSFMLFRFKLQYRLYPGYFAEFHSLYRLRNPELSSSREKTSYFGLALKVNFAQNEIDY